MNSFRKLLARFDNEVAINLALSINYSLKDIGFLISSPFLSILVIAFSIETEKVVNFLLFFPKHLNFSSNSFTSSFIIKW